eukprot:2130542-Pyramimonas_sp.AAC.1
MHQRTLVARPAKLPPEFAEETTRGRRCITDKSAMCPDTEDARPGLLPDALAPNGDDPGISSG